MSIRQEEIRDAIRGFADHISPEGERDQASPGSPSVQNAIPTLQQAEHGSFVIHVGDATFGRALVDPDKAHHAHVVVGPGGGADASTAERSQPTLLPVVSAFFWFFGILPLYIDPYMPLVQHHWLGGLGFLSLFVAVTTTVLSLLALRR
jgi:hypothetical protein